MHLPSAADQIRRFECLRITDIETRDWAGVPGEVLGGWDGDDVAPIAELIAELPAGKLLRCFLPRYGIRAHGSEGVLFEIAFCFRCNGALTLLPGRDEQDLIAFDADSTPAQRLLEKFKALDPHPAAPRGVPG
ncbi:MULTISPECIES: hypothetical protein [Amycolatopsis]|uniref:Uncharacterized protein n=1 Tax=Amycolatopsis dendrobii TaxID=2760662 RepID=A0A7W3VTE4_9PSEU|nr:MULTISPECIES: hypothetical protein [Amycolatopsis]MBB1152716.1 hypothetical protein [Amycolatopsis dendrobii]UKD52106.1 hypothetical protein L3Q65_29815 [Amycolatopsis sp. FU40]